MALAVDFSIEQFLASVEKIKIDSTHSPRKYRLNGCPVTMAYIAAGVINS